MPQAVAVSASASRWSTAVQNGVFGVWDLDPMLEVVHYSPAWKQRLGFPDPLLPDSTAFWRCRVHPEDLNPMMRALQAHFDGYTDTYEQVFRLRCNGSGYRTVLSRGRVVARGGKGEVTRMVGTMADITDRPLAGAGHGLPEHEGMPLLHLRAREPLHTLLAACAADDAGGHRVVAEVADLLELATCEADALQTRAPGSTPQRQT
jgi:hypothetical protein